MGHFVKFTPKNGKVGAPRISNTIQHVHFGGKFHFGVWGVVPGLKIGPNDPSYGMPVEMPALPGATNNITWYVWEPLHAGNVLVDILNTADNRAWDTFQLAIKNDWSGDSSQWTQAKKLLSLNSGLKIPVQEILKALKDRGFKPKVFFGWRSVAVQQQLFTKGVTKVKFSFHNAQLPNGTPNAYAADIVDERWNWGAQAETEGFWNALGEEARARGLVWGGDWTGFRDVAHVQSRRNGELAAAKAGERIMIRAALVMAIFVGTGAPSASRADTVKWLAVAASATAIDKPIGVVGGLRPNFAEAEVAASADCSNMASGRFLAILAKPADRSAAQDLRQKAIGLGTKTKLEMCQAKPDGRFELGTPLIDRSVEKLPANAVNWTESDRISEIVSLSDGVLWLRRTRVDDPDDPREGRRTAALFFRHQIKTAVSLSSDCTDASAASASGRLALSCARGTAADVVLHETTIFDLGSGREIARVPHCRAPGVSPSGLTCQAETVDKAGRLHLQPKPVPVP